MKTLALRCASAAALCTELFCMTVSALRLNLAWNREADQEKVIAASSIWDLRTLTQNFMFNHLCRVSSKSFALWLLGGVFGSKLYHITSHTERGVFRWLWCVPSHIGDMKLKSRVRCLSNCPLCKRNRNQWVVCCCIDRAKTFPSGWCVCFLPRSFKN